MTRFLKLLTARTLTVAGLVGAMALPAESQVPTATLAGRVVDTGGAVIRRATVTVESPNLLGVRRTTTSDDGYYVLSLLPPGRYTVTVEAGQFAPARTELTLGAAQTLTLDLTVSPAAVAEVVNVVAESTAFTGMVAAATNLKGSQLATLPTDRSLLAGVDLVPSVHATGPNGARSMAGASSFENVYLLNGVQIQDNLRGTPLNLYIEDAIQEITTTVSGVSAEYGRFLGGVVNAVTKSGGNELRGSFRTTMSNDSWRATTPLGESKLGSLVPAYEFTAGGPIVANRTWFFGAGRMEDRSLGRETVVTRTPYEYRNSEQRFEGKLSQRLTDSQRFAVAFTGIQRKETNSAYPSVNEVMDTRTLITREIPQRLFSAHYTAAVTPQFFVEGQYSRRGERFVKAGGTNRDRIQGTPLIDGQTGAWWWAPSFCGVCGDESRDNDSFVLKGSLFKSTRHGAHNLTFGYDGYNDRQKGDNRQSASDYWLMATSSTAVDGVVYPVVEPGFSAFIVHWPLTESSRGTTFRMHSLFVNDQWAATPRLSVNLGLRYDKNQGRDHGRNLIANDSMLSPRLGIVWDPAGDGKTTINASFSRYVSALAGSVAQGASAAGTPSILVSAYMGDPINTDPAAGLVPTDEVLRQVFGWYDAYGNETLVQATIPGIAVKVKGSLASPHADEITVGLTRQLGSRASARVDVVNRTFADFYGRRIDTTTGQVSDEFGQSFDLELIENTNVPQKTYRALNAQANMRLGAGTNVGVSYTLSSLRGNMIGENIGSGPLATEALLYPEYRDLSWFAPVGHLAADQRHRMRLWGTYALPIAGDANTLTIGAIEQLQSGTPYGAVGSIAMSDLDGNPYVPNPGYATPPGSQLYYFTARDAFHTQHMMRTDVQVSFARRLSGRRLAEAFVQAQVLNLFNQFQVYSNAANAIDTTVLTANDSPDRFVPFNPFTETPVQGVHWDYGNAFGKPTGRDAYTLPRTFTMSLGLRF
ncbi:MAG: TonB-dependent receptor [Acidobacteria bacterium]|nr:TonB-dependent receptor [Acidobacteriota bacterium]